MGSDRPLSIEPYFGAFVLETLTVGMYGESRNAIREYIQNGFDAIQRAIALKMLAPQDGLIEIEIPGNGTSLTIRDNGIGLPAASAANTLATVGASAKNYRTSAGFRGIGRLAGIVFSDTVTFTTKARGESEESIVVFDAEAMRRSMTPAKGSAKSAEELLRSCMRASASPVTDSAKHYFEVKLEGLREPPEECTSFHQMKNFVCQVAPLPYSPSFPFGGAIEEKGREFGLPIDTVRITLREGSSAAVELTKLYESHYEIDSGPIKLVDWTFFSSPTAMWWAWVGKKNESGSFKDERLRGLRVRLRNIQIDGVDVIRDLFAKNAKSHTRFQDWFVGEVFVDPARLVPNARRDGFEENTEWRLAQNELTLMTKTLGKAAYDVSTGARLTVSAVKKRLREARSELLALRRTAFADSDRVLKLSQRITTDYKRIAKASKDADLPTLAELQAFGGELSDIKSECLKAIGVRASAEVDIEEVQQKTRTEFLGEILSVLEAQLSQRCMAEVRSILRDYLGQPDL